MGGIQGLDVCHGGELFVDDSRSCRCWRAKTLKSKPIDVTRTLTATLDLWDSTFYSDARCFLEESRACCLDRSFPSPGLAMGWGGRPFFRVGRNRIPRLTRNFDKQGRPGRFSDCSEGSWEGAVASDGPGSRRHAWWCKRYSEAFEPGGQTCGVKWGRAGG